MLKWLPFQFPVVFFFNTQVLSFSFFNCHSSAILNCATMLTSFTASDFEVSECWGYNRFFRLDLLVGGLYLDMAFLYNHS